MGGLSGIPMDEVLPAPALGEGKSSRRETFGALALTLDRSGAAYLEDHRTLIVSDLHLEKGSGAAARGRLLPALDSHDTLLRLKQAIETYSPARVVCLGDSFHDAKAGERMAALDKDELGSLCALVPEWVWIGGNHDPEVPGFCAGSTLDEIRIGGVLLRHEPNPRLPGAQVAGHLHPKVSVSAGGYRFSGRCFCLWPDLLILPAFGAFAGGLSCSSPAIRGLHEEEPKLFMLHASKLWRVS